MVFKGLFMDYAGWAKVNKIKPKYYEETKWLYQRRWDPPIFGIIAIIVIIVVIFILINGL